MCIFEKWLSQGVRSDLSNFITDWFKAASIISNPLVISSGMNVDIRIRGIAESGRSMFRRNLAYVVSQIIS